MDEVSIHSDPLDRLSDLSTGGNDASSVPLSFDPDVGHAAEALRLPASSHFASSSPCIPAEAVARRAHKMAPAGPGSVVAETSGGITFNLQFDAAAMASTTAAANFPCRQRAGGVDAIGDKSPTRSPSISRSTTAERVAVRPPGPTMACSSIIRRSGPSWSITPRKAIRPLMHCRPGRQSRGNRALPSGNAQLKLWSSSLSSTISGVPGANNTSTDDGSATFATDINPNLLVGVALHELTHALGRVPYGSQPDLFDFYRFTSAGTQLFANGNTAPAAYFSLDGGLTKIADYARLPTPAIFSTAACRVATIRSMSSITTALFRVLTAADKEQLDALGFHLASPLTTTIQTDTKLDRIDQPGAVFQQLLSSETPVLAPGRN